MISFEIREKICLLYGKIYILGGMFMKQLYLYGIGGPEDGFRVIRYCEIDQADLSALTLRYEATICLCIIKAFVASS